MRMRSTRPRGGATTSGAEAGSHLAAGADPTDAVAGADAPETPVGVDPAGALLGAAPIAFAVWSPDGRIRYVNAAFAQLIGVPPGSVIDRPGRDVLPQLWGRLESVMRWVSISGQPVANLEVSVRAGPPPSFERHWLAGAFPVGAGHGDGDIGLLVVDITARERAEREVRVLARATNLFAAARDRPAALDHAARLAIPEFADACLLYLPSRDDAPTRVVVAHRDADVEARLHALRDQASTLPADGPTARAIRHGTPLFNNLISDNDRRRDARDQTHLAFLQTLDASSAVTVPLAIGERRIGAMTLLHTGSSGRRHEPHDVELAAEVGRRIAQALENIRLEEDARRATARLDLLARVGELLAIELDLPERLREITRIVLPDLGDGAAVHLADGPQLRLVAMGHRDEAIDARVGALPLTAHRLDDDLPPCQAFRTARPVRVDDVPRGVFARLVGPAAETMPDARMRSLLCVPLQTPTGAIGVLSVAWTRTERSYDDDDVRLAAEVARRIAPAVHHAQAYARDREIVEVLQRSLLPSALPDVPGVTIASSYLPGTEGLRIGGDWYDATVLPDGRLFLAIGDVVGHGVRAATMMGRLRVALQAYALQGLEPAAMLDHVNRNCFGGVDADMATLCVLVLDPISGRVVMAAAGHPPPAVRDADGVEFLAVAGGPPVCAVPRATYRQTEALLAPGATLVLYTDGLVERRGEDLGAGLDRLADVLDRAPAAPRAVADHLVTHRRADGVDDIAVLVVQLAGALDRLTLELTADPRELGRLRRALHKWLVRVGASSRDRNDLVLALNEAVANAVEHAYGLGDALVSVEACYDGGAVVLTVRDRGRWRPRRDDGGGRGLQLMRALTDDVEVVTTSDGTEVRMRRAIDTTAVTTP